MGSPIEKGQLSGAFPWQCSSLQLDAKEFGDHSYCTKSTSPRVAAHKVSAAMPTYAASTGCGLAALLLMLVHALSP